MRHIETFIFIGSLFVAMRQMKSYLPLAGGPPLCGNAPHLNSNPDP